MGTVARVSGMAVVTVSLLLLAVPASAGGWWSSIDLDKDPIAVGESVTATAAISSPVRADARGDEEASTYYAYLVRGIDRDRLDDAMTTPQADGWWTPPPTRVQLSDIEILGGGPDLARARFTVPDVEPGLYSLMFCTEGCTDPLADVIPLLDVAVHGDVLLAHTLRTLGSDPMTEAHLTMVEDRLGSVSETVQDLTADVDRLLEASAASTPSSPTPSDSSEASPVASPLGQPPTPPVQSWIPVAAAFLAGATLAAFVASLRQRRRVPQGPSEPRVVVAEPASLPEPVGAAPE